MEMSRDKTRIFSKL